MDAKDWRSGTSNTIPITHDHQSIQDDDDDDYHVDEGMELKRGPWTAEEDLLLINYISNHGEGRWNSLALSAGLKRTGKSCRLRWLNYLRPDVKRGNITPEEQLLILQLHSRWGNRWSKIAQYLQGRTDNEIKNYWRTRVQKQAKQLRCDVNSKLFKDTMRYIWMPRLAEKIRAAATTAITTTTKTTTTTTVEETSSGTTTTFNNNTDFISGQKQQQGLLIDVGYINTISYTSNTPEYSSTTAASLDSFGTSQQDYNNYRLDHQEGRDNLTTQNSQINYSDSFMSPPVSYFNQPQQRLGKHEFGSCSSRHEEQQISDIGCFGGGGGEDNGWENFLNPEDIWFLHQHL